LEENLNYSAERLVAVWPSRFPTKAAAEPYARQPDKLANKVYANRLGNGNEASGDGWRYRGRGPIQLTGKANYEKCGAGIGEDLVRFPCLLLTPSVGLASAGWFWHTRGCNRLADEDDHRAITRIINGGQLGLDDRIMLVNRVREAITNGIP
jgi:putative chitinase